MRSRAPLPLLRLGCSLLVLSLLVQLRGAPSRPNVIVILTDDLGYADLGAQGQERDVRTPHLDRFAAEGVRCTAGYVTSPQCSPSRAGLITGRYQQRLGIDTIPDMPLPLAAVTIPERLRGAGYTSGQIGKWHLEPNPLCLNWAAKNLPEQKPNAARRGMSRCQDARDATPGHEGGLPGPLHSNRHALADHYGPQRLGGCG